MFAVVAAGFLYWVQSEAASDASLWQHPMTFYDNVTAAVQGECWTVSLIPFHRVGVRVGFALSQISCCRLIGGSVAAFGLCPLQTCWAGNPPIQQHSLFLSICLHLFLSPFSLIMALRPGKRMTEVNAPLRRWAILNEAEGTMNGWNKPMKDRGDRAEGGGGTLKETDTKEGEMENYNLSQRWYFLPCDFLTFLTLACHLGCSLHWSLLKIDSEVLISF